MAKENEKDNCPTGNEPEKYLLPGGTPQFMQGTPCFRPKSETIVLVPVTDDSGNTVIQEKILESIVNPLDYLSYDDFRLSSLLASGVKPQAIKIINDHRLGVDDIVISQFNDHVDELFEQMSNENN